MKKICLVLWISLQISWSSCGDAPEVASGKFLANGNYQYKIGSESFVSSPKVLKDSIDGIFKNFKNVAIVQMKNIGCTNWGGQAPDRCTMEVQIDTVLKSSVNLSGFRIDFINPFEEFSYLHAKPFLLYSNDIQFTKESISARGPCYSFPTGYFIENKNIINYNVAFMQKQPIAKLGKFPVGLSSNSKAKSILKSRNFLLNKSVNGKNILRN